MTLQEVSKQTLDIVANGRYVSPSGREVDISSQVGHAVRGTVLHRPGEYSGLRVDTRPDAPAPRIEVTDETTAQAGRRLVEEEPAGRVVALNFASAKNPGGGFLTGAKAQEEDLARCSALYTCQLEHPGYYAANRADRSMIYSDHIIYSPDVPFFRGEDLSLLESPFLPSIITAPAPNAGEASSRGRREGRKVKAALEARAGYVLKVAAAHQHRTLVLGAWGCGVFRNEPEDVADAFGMWLEHAAFQGAFDRGV